MICRRENDDQKLTEGSSIYFEVCAHMLSGATVQQGGVNIEILDENGEDVGLGPNDFALTRVGTTNKWTGTLKASENFTWADLDIVVRVSGAMNDVEFNGDIETTVRED